MADVKVIYKLIQRSSRVIGLEDYTSEQIEAALQSALGLDTQLVEDQTYYVIEDGDRLVACGGWSFRKTLFGNDKEGGRDAGRIDPVEGAARIRAFFVDPDYARRGLGTLLLTTCENAAIEHGYHQLELMATMPGKRLYERFGYIAAETIEYDLGEGLTIPFVPMTKKVME
nr:GNAT family N-acetyltransferase [Pleionea sp. CnH1-48]